MTFDIPNKDGLWVFNTGMLTTTWTTWQKPTQYNNFILFMAGGGGGGGCAFNSNVSATGGAGGGGGGGSIIANIPSYLMPDILYLQVGKGAARKKGINQTGDAGGVTYVAYYPNTNAANLLFSANGGAGGIGGGTGGAGGGFTINQTIFSASGTNGGAGTNANTNYTDTRSIIFGGTGGGNGGGGAGRVSTDGGAIIGSNIFPTLAGGTKNPSGVGAGGVGKSGYLIKKPFTALGGTGGSGTIALSPPGFNGSTGGDGIWGSGGGGAGAGSGGSDFGNNTGGAGGDGFIIIIGY